MKMAIIGVGNIAEKMAVTVQGLSSVEAYAAGSRDIHRARDFAGKFGFRKAYGSYEKLLDDPEIDLVYVAVPHSHHFKVVKQCLEHDKNVLCEKSFTVNADQARTLFALAEQKKLLLTEAIWTRYMPSRKIIDELLAGGIIGEATSMTANLGYNIANSRRIVDPCLAGGALLDLGVYMIHLGRMVFGTQIEKIETTPIMFETGADARESITMTFKGGKMAVMHCNACAVTDRRGTIFGTEGYMDIQNVNNPEKISVYNDAYQLVGEYKVPGQITGYEYEVLACEKALAEHRTECPEIPHEETVAVMEILDAVRKSWGYEIPDIR